MNLMHFRGQETAKRALEIAASGPHSVLLVANRGQGKRTLGKIFRDMLQDAYPGPCGDWPYWAGCKPEDLAACLAEHHFDMVVSMNDLPASDWFLPVECESSEAVYTRVHGYASKTHELLPLTVEAKRLLCDAADKLRMSPQDLIAMERVASTIAWMTAFLAKSVQEPKAAGRSHVAEALSYSQRQEELFLQKKAEQREKEQD